MFRLNFFVFLVLLFCIGPTHSQDADFYSSFSTGSETLEKIKGEEKREIKAKEKSDASNVKKSNSQTATLHQIRLQTMANATFHFAKNEYKVKHARSIIASLLSAVILDVGDSILDSKAENSRAKEYWSSMWNLDRHVGIMEFYFIAFLANGGITGISNLRYSSNLVQKSIGTLTLYLQKFGLASIVAFELVHFLNVIKNNFNKENLEKYLSIETRGKVATGVISWWAAGKFTENLATEMRRILDNRGLLSHHVSNYFKNNPSAKLLQAPYKYRDEIKVASSFSPAGIARAVSTWTLAAIFMDHIGELVSVGISEFQLKEFNDSIIKPFSYIKNINNIPDEVGLGHILNISKRIDDRRKKLLKDSRAEILVDMANLSKLKIQLDFLDSFQQIPTAQKVALLDNKKWNNEGLSFWKSEITTDEIEAVSEVIKEYIVSDFKRRFSAYQDNIAQLRANYVIELSKNKKESTLLKEISKKDQQMEFEFSQHEENRYNILLAKYNEDLNSSVKRIKNWESRQEKLYGIDENTLDEAHRLFNLDKNKPYADQIKKIESNFLNFTSLGHDITIQHLALMQQMILHYGIEKFGKSDSSIAQKLKEKRDQLIQEYVVQLLLYDKELRKITPKIVK